MIAVEVHSILPYWCRPGVPHKSESGTVRASWQWQLPPRHEQASAQRLRAHQWRNRSRFRIPVATFGISLRVHPGIGSGELRLGAVVSEPGWLPTEQARKGRLKV